MVVDLIENDFKTKVCEQIRLVSEGLKRYKVLTPFMFDDGDHFVIYLKREGENWVLSDEGHTYMHLSYDLEEKWFTEGKRKKIIISSLAAFDVEDRQGELALLIPENRYGDALYSFVQALMKVSDVSFLSREIVHSTFMEDFRRLIEEAVPEGRWVHDWYNKEHDPKGQYTVDYRVNGMQKPLMIFALPNVVKVLDSTITLLKFESWNLSFNSLAIFENIDSISPSARNKLLDIGGKPFTSLSENRPKIIDYLREVID